MAEYIESGGAIGGILGIILLILAGLSFAVNAVLGVILIIIAILAFGVRVLLEYRRAVIFTLGRFTGVKGPGLVWVIPIIQQARMVDLRLKTVDIPKQEVITKDNIPAMVNTVVYFKVERPADVLIKVEDYEFAVAQYTQTALRDVVGNAELDSLLTEREKIAEAIRKIVDQETNEWGVDISSIKIQEIELPAEMKRAMAKQAEAERVRRATITISEGELQASDNLRRAAENLSKSPGALHLRTLQTVTEIAKDPSEKIVLVLPAEGIKLVETLTGKK